MKKFCAEHGFGNYARMDLEEASPDHHWATASRRIGGCESSKPVAIIDVTYDKDYRVKSITVRGASM